MTFKTCLAISALSLGIIACTKEPKAEPTPVLTQVKEGDLESIKAIADADKRVDALINLAQKTVYFDFDSATLKKEAQEQLVVLGDALAQLKKTRIRVAGHADARGSNEYNLALSERRATAIREFLLLQGVAAEQIETVGFGEEKLAAEGQDEAAHSKNRRGEIERISG